MSSKPEIFESKSVVKTLEQMMVNVTKEDCNPETVNAACNCAARITDILKLHLEVHKLSLKQGALKSKT